MFMAKWYREQVKGDVLETLIGSKRLLYEQEN